MALSNVSYTADGITDDFVVPFDYILAEHVIVTINDVVTNAYTYTDAITIKMNTVPSIGTIIYISRNSGLAARLTDYLDGSELTESDLNTDSKQAIYLIQEASDDFNKLEGDTYIKEEVDAAIALKTNIAYETVSKNLDSWDAVLSYTSGDLTSITYSDGIFTIIKTFNYTVGELTSIVLSGDTPLQIDLTKTFTYLSGNLSEVTYS
jgi:hypothetical protein